MKSRKLRRNSLKPTPNSNQFSEISITKLLENKLTTKVNIFYNKKFFFRLKKESNFALLQR